MNPAATAASDRACADVAAAAQADHPRLTLATTILASSLAFIDGSVVNVALPAIGGGLHAGATGLQWAINGYLLPLSALLLAGGALGDLYGRRKLLICGLVLFAAASLVCAWAADLGWLLAGRVGQGVGAAMLLPNSLAILGATFAGEARGRAIGVWAAVGAAVGAVGPLIGGWLVDQVGWRTIFYLNLPVAVVAVGLSIRYVHDTRDAARPPLDGPGVALATIGLASVTWALTVGSGPGGVSPGAVAGLLAGTIALGLFVWAELRRGDRAMLPPSLFSSRAFVGLSLLTFLLYGALGGLLVLLPYVLIETADYSATTAGAALLPFPLIIAFASPSMGRLAGKIGPRLPLTLGPLLVAAGFALAIRIGGRQDYWTGVLPALLVIAIGMAGAVAPLTTAVLASVDARHIGVASGFNSAVARTGGLIATALLGAVLAARGEALVGAFRMAAVVGAGAAFGAAACAWLLVGPKPVPGPPRERGSGAR